MDRRDFMKTSVVAGAYAILGSPWAKAEQNSEPWFDRPMRWAQLVLVENDPGRFDPRGRMQAACQPWGTAAPRPHRSPTNETECVAEQRGDRRNPTVFTDIILC